MWVLKVRLTAEGEIGVQQSVGKGDDELLVRIVRRLTSVSVFSGSKTKSDVYLGSVI